MSTKLVWVLALSAALIGLFVYSFAQPNEPEHTDDEPMTFEGVASPDGMKFEGVEEPGHMNGEPLDFRRGMVEPEHPSGEPITFDGLRESDQDSLPQVVLRGSPPSAEDLRNRVSAALTGLEEMFNVPVSVQPVTEIIVVQLETNGEPMPFSIVYKFQDGRTSCYFTENGPVSRTR